MWLAVVAAVAPMDPTAHMPVEMPVTVTTPRLRQRSKRWKTDPVAFSRDVLQAHPWPKQADIMRDVAKHRRVAVRACHASGKTFMAAQLVLWWIMTRPQGVVISTSATFTQVRYQLWREVHHAANRSRVELPREALSTTALRLSPTRFALGLSTNEPTRIQGFHAPAILVIVDEANGVSTDIWNAIESLESGGEVRVLIMGNPVVPLGFFYEAFTRQRSLWVNHTISAFDTPNLATIPNVEHDPVEALQALTPDELDVTLIKGLTSRRWVWERITGWGVGSPMWKARVLGEFPAQAEDALIPLSWIERAEASVAVPGDQKLIGGIDVAGPGEDETVVVARRGVQLEALHAWNVSDARGPVLAYLKQLGGPGAFSEVRVDSVGIGHYFSLDIRDAGYRVVPIVGGAASRNPQRFLNKRAELHWGLREAFQGKQVAGLTDQLTVQQLSMLRYLHTSRGLIQMVPKADMMESPDRAEGVVYAFGMAEQGIGIW